MSLQAQIFTAIVISQTSGFRAVIAADDETGKAYIAVEQLFISTDVLGEKTEAWKQITDAGLREFALRRLLVAKGATGKDAEEGILPDIYWDPVLKASRYAPQPEYDPFASDDVAVPA